MVLCCERHKESLLQVGINDIAGVLKTLHARQGR